MKKKETKVGRPPKEGQLRNVTFNVRVTEDDRELLRLLTAKMEEPSDTQTIVRLIREKARALKISLPSAQ